MLKQESLRTYIIGGTMLRRSHQNINSRLTKTTVMSLFGLFIFYNDNAGCAYQFFFKNLGISIAIHLCKVWFRK